MLLASSRSTHDFFLFSANMPKRPREPTIHEFLAALDPYLPKVLSWLVASYDSDLKERCPTCTELWGDRKLRACFMCRQQFHVQCLTQAICGPCTPACHECEWPIILQDLITCDECNKNYHYQCFGDSEAIFPNCHSCESEETCECDICEREVSDTNICFICDRATCQDCSCEEFHQD